MKNTFKKPVAIPVNKLHGFENHPFKVLDNEEMNTLIESIQHLGIITPLTVRPLENTEDEYEVISGHRRLHAAVKAGLNTVPAFIFAVNRDEAAIMLVDNNLHREHILPSEKAFAYKLKMDALNHQGASRQLGERSNFSELRSNLDRSWVPLKFCPIWTEFPGCSFLVLSIRFCRSGQFDKRDRSDIIGHIGRIGWIDLGIFHDDIEQVAERKAFHVVPLRQTVIGNLVEAPQHHAVGVHDPDQNIRRQVKGGIAVFQFHQKLRRRAFPLSLLFCEVSNQLQNPVMEAELLLVGFYDLASLAYWINDVLQDVI